MKVVVVQNGVGPSSLGSSFRKEVLELDILD
jgi:hypothetical protein